MGKVVNFFIVLVLILSAFIFGVKYAEQVKSHASWMFESKDEEIALPDLSNEEIDGASLDVSVDGQKSEESTASEAAIAPMDTTSGTVKK